MTTRCMHSVLLTSAMVVMMVPPGRIDAQVIAISHEVRPLAGVRSCPTPWVGTGPGWETVFEARRQDPDVGRRLLAALHDSLHAQLEAGRSDVEIQFLTAVVAGLRADLEGGRSAVGLASEAYRRTSMVLELDPEHAGAHHLVGRLHAAVMRMDRVTRFVATRVLGGGELSGASWPEARVRMEFAVARAPCVPDHHFELARLYAELGQVGRARERLEDALALSTRSGPYSDIRQKAERLLAKIVEAS